MAMEVNHLKMRFLLFAGALGRLACLVFLCAQICSRTEQSIQVSIESVQSNPIDSVCHFGNFGVAEMHCFLLNYDALTPWSLSEHERTT